jgi:hypothetical protein
MAKRDVGGVDGGLVRQRQLLKTDPSGVPAQWRRWR